VEGFLEHGRVLARVESIRRLDSSVARRGTRRLTKGGMASKLDAARIAGHSGIPMVIANGARPGVLTDLLAGASIGTLFVPPRARLTSKKRWIAFARRRPGGSIIIDAGAAEALLARGKSLLASGIKEITGQFEAGAFVHVTDEAGAELARGVSSFSSSELRRVRGMRSAEAARALGCATAREVIHKDQLVLAREWQQE